jgi:predicted dehydrogenase
MAFYSRRDFVATASAAAISAKSFAQVKGANERLKIGIIGCGGMASGHLDGLLKAKDAMNIEVAAVCDVYGKRRDNFAQRSGGKPFKNYKELLGDKSIDYVLIATPEHWHAQITLDALDAGKHVYVEKPMTHTIEEAKKVVAKLKQYPGRKLQVGVQGMSDDSYEAAWEQVKSGALGKVVLCQIDYSRNHRDDFWSAPFYKIDEDAKPGVNLDWNMWLGPAKKRAWDPERYFRWRRYWDYSGGIATDLYIHRCTRLIKALNLQFPEFVVATGGKFEFTKSIAEIPDTFNVLADYPGGPTMQLVSSMANDTPVPHLIRGHHATLTFDRNGFTITPQRDFANEAKTFTYKKTGAENTNYHHRNLQAAIRTGEALKCDSTLGYYGVVLCEMSVESLKKRQYLKWDSSAQKARKA